MCEPRNYNSYQFRKFSLYMHASEVTHKAGLTHRRNLLIFLILIRRVLYLTRAIYPSKVRAINFHSGLRNTTPNLLRWQGVSSYSCTMRAARISPACYLRTFFLVVLSKLYLTPFVILSVVSRSLPRYAACQLLRYVN